MSDEVKHAGLNLDTTDEATHEQAESALFGCVWLAVMMAQVVTFGPDARVKINRLRFGLFWHFLDIVWIAIFSVVYLQGLIH